MERWVARGRVQGVGFRFFVYQLAQRFGLTKGYVSNLSDGTVEIILEIEAKRKPMFLDAVKRGNGYPLIKVESLTQEGEALIRSENLSDSFRIV